MSLCTMICGIEPNGIVVSGGEEDDPEPEPGRRIPFQRRGVYH